MVRDFQKVISEEAKQQILEKEGRLPDCVVACVGGGSNAMGMFYDFIPDKSVRLVGAEAAGKGIETKLHAATVAKGSLGIFHGMKSYFLQNEEGQIAPVYSISAGLDYPGVGRSTPTSIRPAVQNTCPSPMKRQYRHWNTSPEPRASFRQSSLHTQWQQP